MIFLKNRKVKKQIYSKHNYILAASKLFTSTMTEHPLGSVHWFLGEYALDSLQGVCTDSFVPGQSQAGCIFLCPIRTSTVPHFGLTVTFPCGFSFFLELFTVFAFIIWRDRFFCPFLYCLKHSIYGFPYIFSHSDIFFLEISRPSSFWTYLHILV